jgi:signal transduction histidine kinase/PAS domain-containing protein
MKLKGLLQHLAALFVLGGGGDVDLDGRVEADGAVLRLAGGGDAGAAAGDAARAAGAGSAGRPPPRRREARERRERERELVEDVLESTAVGLAVLRGPDFVYELVNPAYRALSPFREILGWPFETVWPETADAVLPIFRRVMESGVPFEAADMRVDIRRAPEGPIEESYFSCACRRLPGTPGEPPALLVHVVDTTQLVLARRQAEDRARREAMALAAEQGARAQAERARDRFAQLARLVAEVSEGADLETAVDTVLRLSVSLLGADDGALRLIEEGGASVRTFVALRDPARAGEETSLDHLPHSREAAEVGQAVWVATGDAQGDEAGLLRRAGHASALVLPLAVEGSCFGFMDVAWKGRAERPPPQDLAFAKAMADQGALAITRAWVLESERAARTAAEALSRREELRGSVLAHELRSPIQAIAVTSKALLQRSGLDAHQVDAVGRIASVARRMQGLVEELLEDARAHQGGGLPMDPVRTDIQPICARAIQQLLDSHPGGQVRFTLTGSGEGVWDPSRLEQVVSNLVGNALERTPAGAAVEVQASGTAHELFLTVRNQGPVIPAELLPALFDPFRRGDGRGSLGLGLYIVREIVRAHGGEVAVSSDRATGTCFTVRLPRSAAEG